MSHVISASRRTDVPAFYADWFIKRLRSGYVFVQHPFTRKLLRVSLKQDDISTIVFWSKNYSPLLSKLSEIEKITQNLFFHYTITATKELELNTPDYKDSIQDYIFLAKRYSPGRIIWRFDPICVTDKISFAMHEARFIQCIDLLKGHAQKCFISFVHPYKKILNNLQKYTNHTLYEPSMEKKCEFALRLAAHAEKRGLQLFACCNDYLLSEKIMKARCIDGQYLSGIFNSSIDTRPASTRKQCACTKSIDIGAYTTCAHGCIYCYANIDKNAASDTYSIHNPDWNALHMHVDETTTYPTHV
ncbi:MAG TPA: DUF1848 domain-containing protein [Nitrospirota bacterium]|nr:DUF1848 domain-containing protein [Nitrospirota bacterium]